MNDQRALILDNVILSSFEDAGWLSNLENWTSKYRILTSERIWKQEFQPYSRVGTRPEWLEVRSTDLSEIESPALGEISKYDWSCIGLAESLGKARIITNDRKLKSVASNRDIPVSWGTAFAIDMYERCAISEAEYSAGLDAYIDDLHLNQDIVRELERAEKPD